MISDPHKKFEININGEKIPVWTYGNKNNPPVIYLHGLYHPFSNYIGDLPMRHTKELFYFICFDLPGEGKSKTVKMDNLIFIKQVIDSIEPKRKVTLFGYSYGGLLSLEYTVKYPGKVKELVIASTPVIYGIFNFFKISSYIPIFRKRKIEKKYFQEFKFLKPENLKKIKVPVLLYYSNKDYVANLLMAKKLLKMLPNAKLFTAKDLNHRYGLHRIDQTGLLNELKNFIEIEAKN